MKTEWIQWIGLGLSLVATFLCSLFHAALASSSKISISRFLEDRNKQFRQKVLEQYDAIKTAVEFLRALFLIAFLVYVYSAFPRLRFWPFWLFLVSLGVYLILFDYLPRWMTSLNKNAVLGFFLPSFQLFLLCAAPLLFLSRRLVEREEKEGEKKEERETSDEEIDTFIDAAKEEGIIEKGEDDLLRSVVEFGDTVVREIMTPRVDMVCIRREATVRKLRGLIITEKYSRIPVYKERIDNIEGIIIAKDLLQYSDDQHGNDSIEPLIRPVIFVPESMKVAELLKEFQKSKQKLTVVVDEHGGVSGLVTMEDLMEEIVGEIQDEYDIEETRIVQNAPFDYVVSGDVEVEELEDLFKTELAEDDYITASGLVTHHLGRLPKRGEVIPVKSLSVEILDVDQKRIKKLRIRKPESSG
ncbi:MAG: hemolysin family protein [Candidatus Aminicenantales bacterium]